MSAALLEVSSLSAGYGGTRVVHEVSASFREGQLWVVLGPNGAGKSTLMRALLALTPAVEGSVRLRGRLLTEHPRVELARSMGWVPQSVELDAGFTGLELTLLGRSPHLGLLGLASKAEVEKAGSVLQSLGIAHLADRPSTQVSGGERRLLLLARAFLQAPEVLVLDEPTAFLDLRHQVEALDAVRRKVREGMLAIAVLHDVNLAAAYADRVMLLQRGRVLAQGPTAEVLRRETLEALYGLPMTHARSEDGQPLFAPSVNPL